MNVSIVRAWLATSVATANPVGTSPSALKWP